MLDPAPQPRRPPPFPVLPVFLRGLRMQLRGRHQDSVRPAAQAHAEQGQLVGASVHFPGEFTTLFSCTKKQFSSASIGH